MIATVNANATATATLIVTEEKDAQHRHHGARQFVTSGILETKETFLHVILMLVEHAATPGTARRRQGLRSQILPSWAPARRIVAVELDEDEVAEILAGGADPFSMTIETDIMIPGTAL